jgi:hypothetical protein
MEVRRGKKELVHAMRSTGPLNKSIWDFWNCLWS